MYQTIPFNLKDVGASEKWSQLADVELLEINGLGPNLEN